MDIVYLGAIALFFAVTWAMASGCDKLGGQQ
ncbi:MAG: potassium ABC transporter ATPase [Pseudomonadota bacterium]